MVSFKFVIRSIAVAVAAAIAIVVMIVLLAFLQAFQPLLAVLLAFFRRHALPLLKQAIAYGVTPGRSQRSFW